MDTKSLQDKLKVFFKKGGSASLPARNDLAVTPDLERELSPETPINRRLRALREVSEKALVIHIQEGGVEKIWKCTYDILEDSNVEARHTALSLWRSIAEGQAEYLLVMRTTFLHFLRETHLTYPPEDSQHRFKLLSTLTNTGKNIVCFEEEIGPFLLEWLPQIQNPTLVIQFVELVTNVVKFNATYLDEEIVRGIVKEACQLCEWSASAEVVSAALCLLEAVLCYAMLPRAALHTFVSALCRSLNTDHCCRHAWKLLRHVLGADLGYAALQQLAALAADGEPGAARGAVWAAAAALWGGRRLPALRVSPLTVLPSFRQAVCRRVPVLTYEVLTATHVLCARCPSSLSDDAWDVVFQILREVIDHDRALCPTNDLLHNRLHNALTSLEQLQDSGQYGGDCDLLLDLIDHCGHERPEWSCRRLVSMRLCALSATGTAADVAAVARRYVTHDSRHNVRLHTLDALHTFVQRHSLSYTEELVELVGVEVVGGAAGDADGAVRSAAVRVLSALAQRCHSDAAADLVDLLEKVLNRPFDSSVAGGGGDGSGPGPADAESEAALVLSSLVHQKLVRGPGSLALRPLLVLVDHLELHYKRPAVFQNLPHVRLKILELLFGLRTNSSNCVGFTYCADGDGGAGGAGGGGVMVWDMRSCRIRPLCSPFLLAESRRDSIPGACVVPLGRVASSVCSALTREQDGAVLAALLRAVPALVAARGAGLGRRSQDAELLATQLCSLVAERGLCGTSGARLSLSELHAQALPALAALAPLHSQLNPHTLQRVVRCLLKHGMVLRSGQGFLGALTVFTLEARDMLVKLLPEVLLDLSKISDTKLMASPMLEFLSTLTRLPSVSRSLVEDQYMSVFAIVLPYTNPSRYNHYVVSLAHHVIAAWFLKCRLSYRRNFVRFIIHGLHNYIIMPFEEQQQYKANTFHLQQLSLNEDSSNRKRSSSLGSKGVGRVSAVGGSGASSTSSTCTSGSALFHVELTEACLDLLTRYTFTPCSVKPRRTDTAEFLFSGGQSTTWVVGHKLVTITTSGCLQSTVKQGLCERCAVQCRSANPPTADTDLSADTDTVNTDTGDADSAEIQVHVDNGTENSRHQTGPGTTPELNRQNSAEKETGEEEWRTGGGAGCGCWCGAWCEVTIRSPAGDVAWVMRTENQMSWDGMAEWTLQETAPLVPSGSTVPAASSASSGLGDSRLDVTCDSEPRSRSGSSSSASCRRHSAATSQHLHKSSSDSVVSAEKRPPLAASHCIGPTSTGPPGPTPAQHQPQQHRMSTQPIKIPGSPQRQSSSSTTDEDDMLLLVHEGKSRQPVRRSNSSPEMSSSWKSIGASGSDQVESLDDLDPEELIRLPSCEPTATMSLHVSKKGSKKSDLRVSCEAIPEEMSGTSPLTHPHLMTYNSDPGTDRTGADQSQPAREGAAAAAQLQKVASDSTVRPTHTGLPPPARDRDDLPPLARSKRSNTISVMSPTRRKRDSVGSRSGSGGLSGGSGALTGGGGGGGLSAAFVLLQLYHNMSTYPVSPPVPGETPAILNPLVERPLKVTGAQHERTIKNLDLVPPVETYKVGVLYVGPGQQDHEDAILRNEYGSVRYSEFLNGLGSLVSLETDGSRLEPQLFVNLERGGRDGLYTYVWHDDIMQVLFHVATAMPPLQSDPCCNEKRKYIGNDYVSIVYNDSGADFDIHTIKGQFNLCIVVVEPLERGLNRVLVKTKDELIRTKFLPHLEPQLISDQNVALLARQHALHCSLAAQVSKFPSVNGAPYASNCLERLRIIKRLRRRLEDERLAAAAAAAAAAAHRHAAAVTRRVAMDDFNDYT